MTNPIQAQLLRIRERGVGVSPEINPFWRNLVQAVDALLTDGAEPSNARIQKALGYGSSNLPKDTTNWPLLVDKGVDRAIETRDVEGLNKGDAQHAAQLHFLKSKGLLEAYLAWADGRRMTFDLNTGRLYWYAERLQDQLVRLGRTDPQVVLEIGGGSGRWAAMLHERGLVRHYVMVDLPEMLLNSMITVNKYCPGVEIRLSETPDFNRPQTTFWFLETTEIEKVPPNGVDIALNINSMMEMDEAVRDFYIAEIYRALRPGGREGGGLFYNVNRMQRAMTRRNGESYANNPLLYPYRPDDLVLEWEPDECQESCRAKNMVSRHASFAISRVHLKA